MDEMLSLSYSMYSNKGIYALLLGSGISYSSGILTGWGIVLDLIHKVSQIQGEDCGENPDEWYRNKYGKEPDYSELLDELGKTQSERQMLLKSYFEPTDEELEEKKKVPTLAHKAIANLVKNGYIKVIITTNFDKLMERALLEVGVTPTVISNSDNLTGAIPIVHSKCTIVKVHGDYMDTRIKNTISELECYESEMDKLLDRILDEFGLIICGWSAEWDIALRKCFKRCSSHRFSTYWTGLSEPTMKAKELIDSRRAEVIKITGADEFFTELNEKVMSLEDVYRPHPLSTKVAVAMLKKWILNSENKIRLNDMIMKECEYVCQKLNSERFSTNNEHQTVGAGKKRIEEYEAIMERLLYLLANGCYWGDEEFATIWTKSIEMIASTCVNNGYEMWVNLKKYPILLMVYVGGIASIASNRYYNLYAITITAKTYTIEELEPIINQMYPYNIFASRELADNLLYGINKHTPVNDYLYSKLRTVFKDIISVDKKYDYNFDYFECFLGLIYMDSVFKDLGNSNMPLYAPFARYKFKNLYHISDKLPNVVFTDSYVKKERWEALEVGYFDKDYNRFLKVNEKYDEFISNVRKSYF